MRARYTRRIAGKDWLETIMRLVFLILLLANVALFGYIRYAESRVGADAQIALLQMNPERLKLIGRDNSTPELRSTTSATGQAVPVCLEWGNFAAQDVPRAAAALAKLELGENLSQRDGGADGYWVYMLPFKTRAEAERKAGEVRALGITDFYIVQDNDPWRLAIVLGAFKTEEAAIAYLAQIRQQGVRSAIVGARGALSNTFVIRDPSDAIAAKVAALKADFPAATLRATACPETRHVTKNP